MGRFANLVEEQFTAQPPDLSYAPTEQTGVLDTIGAAVQRSNTLGAAAGTLMNTPTQPDAEISIAQGKRDLLGSQIPWAAENGYDTKYFPLFYQATDETERDAIVKKIEWEQGLDQKLANANQTLSFAAQMGAGLLDPVDITVLLPGGKLFSAAKSASKINHVLKGTAIGAGLGAAAGVSSELALQQMQYVNEGAEGVAYSGLGGMVLGGLIGGGINSLHKIYPDEMKVLEEGVGKDLNDIDDVREQVGSVGSMAVPKATKEELGLNLKRPVAKAYNRFLDKNVPFFPQSEEFFSSLKGESGAEKTVDALKKVGNAGNAAIYPLRALIYNLVDDPVWQGLNSLSGEARAVTSQLASTPYEIKGTESGFNVPTAMEDKIKISRGASQRLNDELLDGWIKTRTGEERKRGDVIKKQGSDLLAGITGATPSGMTLKEFEKQVMIAVVTGEMPTDLPEVARVAQLYKKDAYAPKLEEFKRYGLIDEGVENYAPGVPDISKIQQRPREYVEKMADRFAFEDAKKLDLQRWAEPLAEKYNVLKQTVAANTKKIEGREKTQEKTQAQYTELKTFIDKNIRQRADSGFGKLEQAKNQYSKISDIMTGNREAIDDLKAQLTESEGQHIDRLNQGLENLFVGQKKAAMDMKGFEKSFAAAKNLPSEFKYSVKYPVLNFVKKRGGIDPDSRIAKELKGLGIDAKAYPGLYRKGGLQGLDNIPLSEFDDLRMERDIETDNGYIPEREFLQAIDEEWSGRPILTEKDRAKFEQYQADVDFRSRIEDEGIDLSSDPKEAFERFGMAEERRASLEQSGETDIEFAEFEKVGQDIEFYDRAIELIPSLKNDIDRAREIINNKDFAAKASIDKELNALQKEIEGFEKSSKGYGKKLQAAQRQIELKEAETSGMQGERDFIGYRGFKRISKLYQRFRDKANDIAAINLETKNAEIDMKKLYKELDDVAQKWGGNSTDEYKYMKARREREGAETKITEENLRDLLEQAVAKMLASQKQHPRGKYIADAEQLKDKQLSLPDGDTPYWDDVNVETVGGIERVYVNREGGSGIGMEPGFLKRRRILNFVPHKDLIESGFYRSDIGALTDKYVHRSTAFLELTKQFGDAELTVPRKAILDEFNALEAEAKTPKELERIRNDRRRILRNVAVLRDRLLGVDGVPKDPNSGAYRFAKGLRNFAYITKLGGAMPSQIPDLGVLAMIGAKDSVKQAALLTKNIKSGTTIKKMKELQYGGILSELTANTRTMAMNDMLDPVIGRTRFERGLQMAADNFAKANLTAYWNNAAKMVVSGVTEARISDLVSSVGQQKKLDAMDETWMRQNNLYDDAFDIAEQIAKYGETENGMTFMNWDKWDNKAASEKMRAAIVKEVDHTVLTPGLQRSVLLNSSEWAKLIAQFKTFFLVSTTARMLTLTQAEPKKAATAALLMTTFGMMSYAMKQQLAGRELSDDPRTWLAEGVDRAGYFGALMEVSNIMDRTGVLGGGLRSWIGAKDKVPSRYETRSAAGALLGPSLGMYYDAAQIMSAMGSGKELTQGDVTAIKGMIPGLNLPYVQPLVNPVFQIGK